MRSKTAEPFRPVKHALFFLALTTTVSMGLFASCSQNSGQGQINLNVSAASSLIDALKEINKIYMQSTTNVSITPNFASSGTLRIQIENGAPVDVFISAGETPIDNLQKDGLLLDSTRKNLLNNQLVLIVPEDSSLNITGLNDLTSSRVKKIAVGDPGSVPAGAYAFQAFDQAGISEQIRDKIVLGRDVRQVLTYAETGNVDAGVVYLTDARASDKVKIVATAPAEINARIVYPAAVVKASKVPDAAKAYLTFLFGSQAKTVFERYGFTVLNE